MTNVRVCVILTMVILAAACSKDVAVIEALDAVEAFAKELVQAATSGETTAAGIQAAQAYLDSHRADIAARMQRVGEVRGFQIDDETKARLASAIVSAVTEVNTLKITFTRETMSNEDLDAALNTLVEAFNDVLRPSTE